MSSMPPIEVFVGANKPRPRPVVAHAPSGDSATPAPAAKKPAPAKPAAAKPAAAKPLATKKPSTAAAPSPKPQAKPGS